MTRPAWLRVPGGTGAVADVTPLRLDPGFRAMWLGQIGSAIGRESGRYVFPVHVYLLTGSLALLGVVAVFQLIATVVLSQVGGWLSDTWDRRGVILAAGAVMLVASIGLLVLALGEAPPLPLVIVLGVTATSFFTLEQPARVSAVPRLVPNERLPSAIALNSLTFQTMGIVGPAAAALMLGLWGLVAAYAVQVVGYAWMVVATSRMAPIPSAERARESPLQMLATSVEFVRSRPTILGCFGLDLTAMIFALPTGSLLPVLLIEIYSVTPEVVGLLLSARAAGAVLAAVFSGWTRSVRSIGSLLFASVLAYAVVTIAIGVLRVDPLLAVPLLAIAGGADVISVISRAVVIQLEAPDALRGRVTALSILTTAGGPRLGDVRAAAMAEALGAAGSLVAGGVIAVVGIGALARGVRGLRTYTMRA